MEEFHAHLYFTAETRDSALNLREQLRTSREFTVELQPVREGPIGPHTSPMFNAHIAPAEFVRVVYWLMLNHGPHPVLIHPNTGDDLADHTRHALWLGPPQRLELDKL